MIEEDLIFIDSTFDTKDDIFNFVADKVLEKNYINSKEFFLKSLYDREEVMPTSFDFNIAIPHAKSNAINNDFIAFLKLKRPIIWNDNDNDSTDKIFLIAVTSEGSDRHLRYIANLSKKIINDDFRRKLENLDSVQAAYDLFNQI